MHGTSVLRFEWDEVLAPAMVADDFMPAVRWILSRRFPGSAFRASLWIGQIPLIIENLLALAEYESPSALDAWDFDVRHPVPLRNKEFDAESLAQRRWRYSIHLSGQLRDMRGHGRTEGLEVVAALEA